MISVPTLLFCLWIALMLALFRWQGSRSAALIGLIGGWAVLPTCEYPDWVIREFRELGGPTHALAIPGPPRLNKATALGLGCLLGLVLFDWPGVRRLRLRWFDAPMLGWIASPIASALANGHPLAEGLTLSRHLLLAWGAPYAAGRVAFGEPTALRDLARAWTLAGLAYLPIGLVEFAAGPFWYRWLYGGHPYRFVGADRWLGHRPLGLLEDGNQLGMWAATAAVAAAWLWALRDDCSVGRRRTRVPLGPIAAALVAACLLWQSHGSIALMLVALVPVIPIRLGAGRRLPLRGLAIALTVVAVGVASVGVLAVSRPGGREQVRSMFRGLGKSSFTWRLARLEEHWPQLAERPLIGWGRADWSRLTTDGTFADPVALSLGFLAAGQLGLVGALALAGVLFLPILGALRRLGRLDWWSPPWGHVALATALLALNVADLAMNSSVLLPMLLASGGLTTWVVERRV